MLCPARGPDEFVARMKRSAMRDRRSRISLRFIRATKPLAIARRARSRLWFGLITTRTLGEDSMSAAHTIAGAFAIGLLNEALQLDLVVK